MSKKKPQEANPFTQFIQTEVYKAFNRFPNKSYNHKQLSKMIKPMFNHFVEEQLGSATHIEDLNQELKSEIIFLLDKLKHKGEVIETSHGSYKLKPKHAYMQGVIEITSTGAAYLLSEDGSEDVYIAARNTKHALNGDTVKIYLYARHKNQRLEGEVVEVVERAKTDFVGILQMNGRYGFLIPDSQRMHVDIFIPENKLNNAQNGQKAIATIVDWQKGSKNPVGVITQLLGWPGENETEMHAILSEYGFPIEFPAHVEKEADQIPLIIDEKEIAKRRDFRKVTTFTIDPVDAKDFDDALSIQNLPNGNFEIGVHIADVAHYIRPHSFLDKEAYERATSVYLVDRVVPMLPEKLSNGVCSLRPHEDKLCFSAVFEMDANAKVIQKWIGRTVIHSNHRFSYEEAQEVIEKRKGDYENEILLLDDLAKKMRAERFRKGAINFEKAEVKFKLDEKGKPLGVILKESKDAHKLIEEFMLLANKTVAIWGGQTHDVIGQKKKQKHNAEITTMQVQKRPFVYRIHDGPVSERIQSFAKFASRWGYKLKIDTDREIAQSLNGLIKNVQGKKEQNVLEQLAIRSMSKAIYSTENIGHYGLGFEYYTHFTSPIRRYPDVLVHRLLEQYLGGNTKVDTSVLEQECKHSTQMEIRAAEAERASVKYKQVEYMSDKIGQEFEGIISGVTEWGLYVEMTETKCEGMIRLRELDDDFYEFDDGNYCIIGSRTGRRYTIGDSVRVKLMKCDLLKKQIDLKMLTGHHSPLQNNLIESTMKEFAPVSKPQIKSRGFQKPKVNKGRKRR